MKGGVMDTVSTVQENAADILASAKDINEQRAAKEERAAQAKRKTAAGEETQEQAYKKHGRAAQAALLFEGL